MQWLIYLGCTPHTPNTWKDYKNYIWTSENFGASSAQIIRFNIDAYSHLREINVDSHHNGWFA